jgi:hypothetical protein
MKLDPETIKAIEGETSLERAIEQEATILRIYETMRDMLQWSDDGDGDDACVSTLQEQADNGAALEWSVEMTFDALMLARRQVARLRRAAEISESNAHM